MLTKTSTSRKNIICAGQKNKQKMEETRVCTLDSAPVMISTHNVNCAGPAMKETVCKDPQLYSCTK